MRPLLAAAVVVSLLAVPAGATHVPSGEVRYACGAGNGPEDCGIDPVGGGEAVGAAGEVSFGEGWIGGDEQVVGVVVDGEARAYPVKMLSVHEVANDRFGDRPVTVTYCPLCGSAVAFDRNVTIDGRNRTLAFTASGYLYKEDLVMWDAQTGTLWNQILGEAIGTLRDGRVQADHPDAELELISSSIATWDAWRSEHPDSPMLQPVRGSYSDPYEGYYESCRIGVSGGRNCEVDGLHPKTQIVGVTVGNASAAYVVEAVRQAGGVVVEEVGGRTVVVAVDGSATIYDAGDRRFEQQDGAWVDGDGRRWDLAEGRPADGGDPLPELPARPAFWFAWKEMHPDTTVFTAGDPTLGAPESTPGPGSLLVLAGLAAAALLWFRRRD